MALGSRLWTNVIVAIPYLHRGGRTRQKTIESVTVYNDMLSRNNNTKLLPIDLIDIMIFNPTVFLSPTRFPNLICFQCKPSRCSLKRYTIARYRQRKPVLGVVKVC